MFSKCYLFHYLIEVIKYRRLQADMITTQNLEKQPLVKSNGFCPPHSTITSVSLILIFVFFFSIKFLYLLLTRLMRKQISTQQLT